jgi:predicted RNase H-like nuclease (RuvC/YqgF family)
MGGKRYLSSTDVDGVALAAIQGLNQKVEEDVASLRAENAALKSELSELKDLVNSLTQKLTGGGR